MFAHCLRIGTFPRPRFLWPWPDGGRIWSTKTESNVPNNPRLGLAVPARGARVPCACEDGTRAEESRTHGGTKNNRSLVNKANHPASKQAELQTMETERR